MIPTNARDTEAWVMANEGVRKACAALQPKTATPDGERKALLDVVSATIAATLASLQGEGELIPATARVAYRTGDFASEAYRVDLNLKHAARVAAEREKAKERDALLRDTQRSLLMVSEGSKRLEAALTRIATTIPDYWAGQVAREALDAARGGA